MKLIDSESNSETRENPDLDVAGKGAKSVTQDAAGVVEPTETYLLSQDDQNSRNIRITPMTYIADKPGHLIRRCNQIGVSLFFDECRGSDLTPIQYSILSVLHGSKEMDQTTLASEASLDKSTATETIRRLEKKDLISRRRAEHDRRVMIVSLTEKGEKVVVDLRQNVDNVHNRIIAALDEHERPLFIHLLKKVCSTLESESRVKSTLGAK